MTRTIFFQVSDPKQKIEKLISCCKEHYEKKEPIIIFAEDEKTIEYLDNLLWNFPKDSFLPHAVETKDFITITSSKKNISNASIAFNLCPTPLLLEGFRLLYDYEDLTSPIKKQFSILRFEAYKKAKFQIESR
jgi:DNA polymerase IIIc chi subunit